MNKLAKLICGVLFMAGAFCFSACGDDKDEPDPNMPEVVDPDKPVPDPTGTVTMRLRNDTETTLGNLEISADDNFQCNRGKIACIGTVAGLGNVTAIPKTGWSSDMAVEIGKGYVYYNSSNEQYYRILTVDWLNAASNPDAILGVELKYQTPFYGSDEAISVENNNLLFSGEGGEEKLMFGNTSIIPFEFSVDEECSWCRVEKCTDLLENFLSNGLRIVVQPTEELEDTHTSITVETLYGKTTVINVTRQGQAPKVAFADGETSKVLDVASAGGTFSMGLTTNIEAELLDVKANVDWIEVGAAQASANSRSMRNMTVSYTVKSNVSSSEREGHITVSSRGNAGVKATLNITQEGLSFDNVPETVYFDRKERYTTVTLPAPDMSVSSDVNWCQISVDGTKLMIGVDATTEDRKATLTIAGTSVKIKVDQSKYSTGDAYSEAGIVGTVIQMADSVRLVRSENLGNAQWSTENRFTGADDADDGRVNMAKIKAIPKWEIYYPAFALCDALNVDGVSGWYLPAKNEVVLYNGTIWKSTEYNSNEAYSTYYDYHNIYDSPSYKNVSLRVYAVHRFVE